MGKIDLGKYRWLIAALLLFSTTINYMDRQVISYLKEFFCSPQSQGGFGWKNTDFANITSCFTAFYAGMTILAGWIIDKIGTKLGLALSLIIWSLFGMLNAFAGSSIMLHAAIRSLFGIGEAGNFPASIKTVAEWFPKKERSLATGLFISGSNLGAMLASLFVPWCLVYFGGPVGWKVAYIATGAIGFVWLFFWFAIYNIPAKAKKLTTEEYNYIHSDDLTVHAAPSEDIAVREKILWRKLFIYPQTWAYFAAKFLTDGIWWFLLFWLPDYLKKQFGMSGYDVMLPTFIVYGISIVGSIFGGSIPMLLIDKGMEIFKARMTAMFIIAIVPLSLLSTQFFADKSNFGSLAVILAVGVICLGAAAHQAWSANLYTTVSDLFPKKAIGSVTGIGGMAGGLGGVLIQQLAGHLTDFYIATPQKAYLIMFWVSGVVYIISWVIMYVLTKNKRVINV